MKKIIGLILTIIMCFCMCSCSNKNRTDYEWALGDRFKIVEEISDNSCIVYDIKTKVEYLLYYKEHTYGEGFGITVLLDENGEPLLYQGDDENDR